MKTMNWFMLGAFIIAWQVWRIDSRLTKLEPPKVSWFDRFIESELGWNITKRFAYVAFIVLGSYVWFRIAS